MQNLELNFLTQLFSTPRKHKKSVGQLEMSGWGNEPMHTVQRVDRSSQFFKGLAFCLSLMVVLAGCEDADYAPTKASKAAKAPSATAARDAATQVAFGLDPNDRNTNGSLDLDENEYLLAGDYMQAVAQPDLTIRQLHLQGDGNLVLYNTSVWPWLALWQSNTVGLGGDLLLMQTDGNLVLYNQQTAAAVWQSGTAGYPEAEFNIGPELVDGEWAFGLEIYQPRGAGTVKYLYLQ